MVSPSLLNAIKKVSSNFCLGFTDWCSCESCIASSSLMECKECVDKPLNAKRVKLSLTCFSTPQSDKQMMQIHKGKRSANMQRSTAWAVKVFREWISECILSILKIKFPKTFLMKIS